MMNIPRNEYPRPQMVRKEWLNLNGEWEFEFDFGKSGKERGVLQKAKLERTILVPFCPESKLSGIEYKDFINAAWYKRDFTIPSNWKNGRILLNFEAVDYYCEVYMNKTFIGSHQGGYTPFSFDITDYLQENNTVTVYVEDDTRTGLQPCGKQSKIYPSHGCDYTRVTGIWQTVWLEYVPTSYIQSFKLTPDVDNSRIHISVKAIGNGTLTATAMFHGKEVGKASAVVSGNETSFSMDLSELHLWQPLDAKLYDLILEFGEDKVNTYFGMHKITLTDHLMLINDKPVFQRLVLDQGYYPDGIYTAPNDEALKKDIELAMALGFNGARLHQKVFERRFLYHADRMGYMVWGEYGNWGLNHSKAEALGIFMPEWMEAVERDYNSPALIGWCPFNETWDINGHRQDNNVLKNIYLLTKAMDKSRPVIDTSGNYHVMTDIYDIHDYTQDTELFKEHYVPMAEDGAVYETYPDRQQHQGQPYFISEYGGIKWNPRSDEGWGYGNAPKTMEEFVERYCSLTTTLLSNPRIFGLCYTQLYDVEQEMNGLYYYDRTPKFTKDVMEKLKKAMTQVARIEQL